MNKHNVNLVLDKDKIFLFYLTEIKLNFSTSKTDEYDFFALKMTWMYSIIELSAIKLVCVLFLVQLTEEVLVSSKYRFLHKILKQIICLYFIIFIIIH